MSKAPAAAAPIGAPKAKLQPSPARPHPIGAPPPQALAPEEEFEVVGDATPPASPKAKLRPAPARQPPIGAPPPQAHDLELDPDTPGVGAHYPPRGWRIPRDSHREVDVHRIRPDIDDMVEDLASGRTELEARRKWRDRTRSARRAAMRWYTWQVEQGIVPPGPILLEEGAGGVGPAEPAAQPAADPNEPPLYKSQPPAKAKKQGCKGRGKGGKGEGKGGRKGAHPGRGEYSRYAG